MDEGLGASALGCRKLHVGHQGPLWADGWGVGRAIQLLFFLFVF